MESSASSLETACLLLEENGSVSEDTLDSIRQVIGSLESSAGNIREVPALDSGSYTEEAGQIYTAASSGLDTLNNTLEDASVKLEETASALENDADSLPSISADDIRELAETTGGLYENARQLAESTGSVSDALTTLESQTENFPDAADGIRSLNTGLDTLVSSGDTLISASGSLQAAGTEVTEGISSVCSGGTSLSEGIMKLGGGLRTYTGGISSLADKGPELRDGAAKLSGGTDTLAAGAGKLSNAAGTLAEGTHALSENNDSLNNAAALLSEGAGQICDGASQLYNGSNDLDKGMSLLKDGAGSLADGLVQGADEISGTTPGEETIDMFASPVNAEETMITTVENNGHAMAPYMMSVGLWVGCLAFCLMYPLTGYKGKLKSGLAWWGSKASVLYPVAVLQGLLLICLLHAVDGFNPAEMTKTILFACLTSVAFTSIMYFFNITLGKVGSFLMLIFMVVQLSGSAGTYPVEISPAFVADIHAYLPFTYTVDAFRSTISGGGSILTSVILLLLLTMIFTGLTILQFHRMARRRKNSQPLLIDWLEEKGLA